MGFVLGMAEFASIPAGFLGFLGDRMGSGPLTLVSFAGFVLFSGLMLLPPHYASVMAIRSGMGFTLNLSFAAIQSFTTGLFSLEMRDRITGILELSYSLSALAIVPALGFAYERWDWRAPFTILAVLLFAHLPPMLALACQRISSEEQPVAEAKAVAKPRLGYFSGLVFRNGALLFNISGFFLNMGAILIESEFGFLLSSHFNLTEGDSGTATLALASGELMGVMFTIVACVDPRSFVAMEVAGMTCVGISTLYLFFGDVTLAANLSLLFFMFICVEYGIVIRLARAEQFATPADAVAMLGAHIQFHFAGRAVGASVAGVLYTTTGHAMLALVAVAIYLVAALALRLSVYQKQRYELNGVEDSSGEEVESNLEPNEHILQNV